MVSIFAMTRKAQATQVKINMRATSKCKAFAQQKIQQNETAIYRKGENIFQLIQTTSESNTKIYKDPYRSMEKANSIIQYELRT